MRLLPLYHFGEVVAQAKVDDTDYERLSKFRWRVSESEHVVRTTYVKGVGSTSVSLHRDILGLSTGKGVVLHVNHDHLDNRRANLELARGWSS